jgi:hypothetical protein
VKAKRILKPCLKISPRNGEFWVKLNYDKGKTVVGLLLGHMGNMK